ncbi:hypothetical protein AVEN_159252-1 [Araneus ventricosus]|uniref:Uncharacterized protein n=1 Tax=Araneus ventricosus TaxID=182803 RepID=A0A4Y2A068_ARAVE|nr:hypothetical protein AVEN_159252-1 [Araneus ventricosus]
MGNIFTRTPNRVTKFREPNEELNILISRFEVTEELFWDLRLNFEPRSDVEDDSRAETRFPNVRTRPAGECLIYDVRFSLHQSHIHGRSLG